MKLLRTYTENDMLVEEWTRDGKTVAHIVKTPISDGTPESPPVDDMREIKKILQAIAQKLGVTV